MKIMTPVEQIKEKLDIVEFIRGYIPIQPAGKNFKALCPFHKEKTPSFIISPDRQTWHCFGSCSEGGDIFKFLMKYENLEFYEALKILSEKAGIELKKISPIEQRQFDVLYEINEAAKNLFKKNLKENKEATDYLINRGLKNEIIEEFEIGYAFPEFDKLTMALIKEGFNVRDIERAGLNFKTEKGGYVDRFRGRIMFPIFNHFGKAIGFSARILPKYDTGEIGKYINSPETPIFNKSKILYGFHKSKNFIREENKAVLMEGQMDFLMSWQDGVKNSIATSGTALTQDHLKVLRRQTDNLAFCFDNDEAGLKAAERSIDLANSLDFNVSLLIIKDAKDPAELVLKKPSQLKELVSNAQSSMEFYFSRYLTEDAKDLRMLKNSIRIILAKIKNLSPIEQSHWLHELSIKSGVKEEALIDEIKQLKTEKISGQFFQKTAVQKQNNNFSRKELIAQRLLSLAVAKKDFHNQLKQCFDYLPKNYLMIAENIMDKNSQKKFNDADLDELFNLISLRSSFESGSDEEKLDSECLELTKQLRLEHLKEKREELMKSIKKAERDNDEDTAQKLLKEFDEISKIMHN